LAGMRDSLNFPKRKPRDKQPGSLHSPDLAGGAGENHEGKDFGTSVSYMFKKLITPENLWAFVLFLIVVVLIVFTTDDSPVWIYQGF